MQRVPGSGVVGHGRVDTFGITSKARHQPLARPGQLEGDAGAEAREGIRGRGGGRGRRRSRGRGRDVGPLGSFVQIIIQSLIRGLGRASVPSSDEAHEGPPSALESFQCPFARLLQSSEILPFRLKIPRLTGDLVPHCLYAAGVVMAHLIPRLARGSPSFVEGAGEGVAKGGIQGVHGRGRGGGR